MNPPKSFVKVLENDIEFSFNRFSISLHKRDPDKQTKILSKVFQNDVQRFY